MITKQQVQQAIELLKRKKRAFSHRPLVYVREKPVPEGETRLSPETYYYDEWKPVFDAHPELRDALTLVVMASSQPTQTNIPMTPFQRSLSEWLDFYESLSPDALDTDPPLGLHALIRNLADKIFYELFDDDGNIIDDTDGLERLWSVAVNPPSVVQAAGLRAGALHDMLFGALAYHTLPESGKDAMLEQIADATKQFLDANGTGAFPNINGETFIRIAYPIEFLPIAHVFSRALDNPKTSGIVARYFNDLLPSNDYDPTPSEQEWVYDRFAPLFDEGLRDLFARREFSRKSVHGVLRNGFGALVDPTNTKQLQQLLKEILWLRGRMTFYGLMAVLSREFPDHAMRIARLVAKTVSDVESAMTYARLAQRWVSDDASEAIALRGYGASANKEIRPVRLVTQPMRDAAKTNLPLVYQRVFRRKKSRSPEVRKNRSEFARLTASAVMGIETDHIRHYYTEQKWIDLWEGFHDMLTNPSELLKDPQKMAAFREVRENLFEAGWIYDICGDYGGELL